MFLWAVVFYLIMNYYYETGSRSLKLKVPRSKILYYLLQFTWGLPLNAAGALVSIYQICLRRTLVKDGLNYKFTVPYQANFSLGIFIFVCCDKESVYRHESGHSIQNMYYGPFALLCVSIPSMVRYWVRYLFPKCVKRAYDDIWFESQATQSGN